MFKKKKTLLTFISFLLIIGFVLTSLASYVISMSSLRSQVSNRELPLTSDTIYSEIQRDLLRPIFISSLMASDTFLRDWIINGEVEQDAILRYLKEIQDTYNTFTAFFVSEESRNYYHTDGLFKQVQPDDPNDSWYFRVRDLKDDYETNVDIDKANNNALTVFINYRVYDYERKFIGVTGVGLTVTAIQKVINLYQEKYERDIFFIDSHGNIKLSNGSGTHLNGDAEPLQNLIQSSQFLDQISSSASTSLQHKMGNHPVLLNTRYIKEFGWYLVVMQREVEGAAKLNSTLLYNLLFCAVITSIILFITNRSISSYQKDIEQLASTDKLTGLYNRLALDMLFKQALLDQNRSSYDLAVLLLDIDHFKKINDQFGHLAGDAVLIHLAALITSRIRGNDIVCRWGGEEFLFLLKGCTVETAANMAEEIRLSIMNHPLSYCDKELDVTVSIGVTGYQDNDSRDKLIERADKALYRAKADGRNMVCSV